MKSEDKKRTERIVKVFKDTGLNQKQFSELIGVSQQLVSAVLNHSKKPNETILLGIIDNINKIDPIWLFKGIGKNKKNYMSLDENRSPIDYHVKNIVRNQFKEISIDILEKLSSIEEYVKKN
ncbi:helix-turn-helix transcriptional regulator [Polaribacter haliotis]|uniref:Helix-turn-helix transcriptional regulator n=1 Tax=Polaribacter haliotis TaxID=1888915 RepID=A0A7L8AHT3_9FLAO|nr:helix-turn-helix transcriptional regulator [Polaribacter haliotis]QOD61558.1 helix-turn-helix transcriptional regulator [Polaribacter haliotis]